MNLLSPEDLNQFLNLPVSRVYQVSYAELLFFELIQSRSSLHLSKDDAANIWNSKEKIHNFNPKSWEELSQSKILKQLQLQHLTKIKILMNTTQNPSENVKYIYYDDQWNTAFRLHCRNTTEIPFIKLWRGSQNALYRYSTIKSFLVHYSPSKIGKPILKINKTSKKTKQKTIQYLYDFGLNFLLYSKKLFCTFSISSTEPLERVRGGEKLSIFALPWLASQVSLFSSIS